MAYIEYSTNGNSPLQKLLGHNPEVLKNWDLLLDTFYKFSSFDSTLQEEVRRVIAYQIGCNQCMSFGCPSQIINDPSGPSHKFLTLGPTRKLPRLSCR